MESALSSDVRITEALVGGEGRPTPVIILQFAESIERPSEEELWTIVRTLNEKFSAEIHIPRENILVANPGRPLRKLGKGTLDRRAILADYEKDISGVYDIPNGINGSGPFAVPELAGGNDPIGTPAQPTGAEARRTIAVSALLAEHVLTVQAAAEREMEILIAHGDGWAEVIFEQFDIEPDSSLEIGVGWRDR
ncbi:putative AMP-dependent synthetase/ligase domain-containing protein [Seiridium cardinale]|uniref:AMP-dependent synthetase/ligase domain-containing protein n=1 Tax=Seiridium cardinale TaxID=138064 RepID=A0ABR2XIZ9_9PEZI